MFDSEGEIFGGICVNSDCNDTEILMQSLGECCFVNSHIHTRTPYCDENGQSSIPIVFSTIKGPWAVIYWHIALSGKFLFVFIKLVQFLLFLHSLSEVSLN